MTYRFDNFCLYNGATLVAHIKGRKNRPIYRAYPAGRWDNPKESYSIGADNDAAAIEWARHVLKPPFCVDLVELVEQHTRVAEINRLPEFNDTCDEPCVECGTSEGRPL